ncbi:hypothetical protein BV22DRAFT_1102131 [Leucogyrophana mollusca]|uniref:Uncharacterized protein n=1 Tax=Leucogyrophana mollusca TaxID=85980 RepID=A0ACB8BVS7_9AGAM|nr:hypothetical protein BV22DRAFT_1102131 [Leucogyrophana mollusca]
MLIRVKWDRETLHFPLPPPETKLAQLRHDLAEYTHLPPQSFKLVHAGAVMKDDNAPLSAYNIRENSTIALIGGHTQPPSQQPPQRQQQKPKQPLTEQSTISAIQAELERVRTTLVPPVDDFVQALSHPPDLVPTITSTAPAPAPSSGYTPATAPPFPPPYPTSHPTAQNTAQNIATPLEHTRLSELLLQSLLRLDAFHFSNSDWPDARAERKAAVREVQSVLDRLDGAWAAKER